MSTCLTGITQDKLQSCCSSYKNICDVSNTDEEACEQALVGCTDNFDYDDHCKPECGYGGTTLDSEEHHDKK